jgi:hypothetical protein
MNKTLTVYLFFLILFTHTHAVNINVKVGGEGGENIFNPQTVLANVGDNVCITKFLYVSLSKKKIIIFIYSDKS